MITPLGEGLSGHILESVRNLQSYEFNLIKDPPNLLASWRFLSFGGDSNKFIAANESLGILGKRYRQPEYAKIVYTSYSLIKDKVLEAKFPLLLPLGLESDILVFPLIRDVIGDGKDYQAKAEFQRLCRGINTPLPFASFFSFLRTREINGFYYDIFEDSVGVLEEKTGIKRNQIQLR